jgi:hypothetical protein
MRPPLAILIALAVVGSSGSASGAAFWQKHNSPVPSGQKVTQPTAPPSSNIIAQNTLANHGALPQTGGKRLQLHVTGPGPHKGDWLRQYYTLPQGQQEQALQQDPSFRNLSPDKQQKLLDRLRTFNSLSPDKQAKILNRMELFEHLPPEKQAEARNLFRQYQTLPTDQKEQVSQAYQKLRQMSPAQRSQYLNSDEFQNSLNDEQRQLVRGMADVNIGPVR